MPSRIINLNDTSPAAPAGALNVKWQVGASSGTDPNTGMPLYPVSANVPKMVGDSGSGGVAGLVPAPAAGDAAAGKVLKADGSWYIPMQNPMTTPGDIIIGGVAGLPTRLGAGSATQVLTANGAGSAPSWQAAGGGGGGTGWGGGEAAFAAPVLSAFTDDNFNTGANATVAETTPNGIRLRQLGTGVNTNALRSLLTAIPTATSLWTLTVRLRRQSIITNYNSLGLVLKDTVSGKYVSYGWVNNGSTLLYVPWTNANSSLSGTTVLGGVGDSIPSDWWFRIVFDGTNLVFSGSRDGQYFCNYGSVARTTVLTNAANQCGITINPNNFSGNTNQATVLDCFSFSVVNN